MAGTQPRRTLLWAARAAVLGGMLLLWEALSGRVLDPFFVSSPGDVGAKFWDLVSSGRLFIHAGITMIEAFAGFFAGALGGLLVGLALGQSRFLAEVLDPFISMFYSLPKVALAPLFILWFGIGMSMKILLTASVVFFLVFLNTFSGVRAVSADQLTILRLMGARRRHLMLKVILPSAFTWVFAGLRLSVPYALIGAIVAEIIAANRGLGFLLQDAAGQFDTGGVFAVLIAIVVLAQVLHIVVNALERIAMPWRKDNENREVTI